jgi:hypothetical protein
MTVHEDRDFREWQQQWQTAIPRDISTEEQIRHYVKRRTGMLWSWIVGEFIIAGIALPILAYMGWASTVEIERFAMWALAVMTVATIMFSWWNWRGVLRSSANSVAEYVAISAERLRRMRLAWRVAWMVLIGEVVLFTIWIWDHLYSGAQPHDAGAERFAWSWLAAFSGAFAIYLVFLGRWIKRDAERFERLRRELDT